MTRALLHCFRFPRAIERERDLFEVLVAVGLGLGACTSYNVRSASCSFATVHRTRTIIGQSATYAVGILFLGCICISICQYPLFPFCDG
jgi:hypothetical protein